MRKFFFVILSLFAFVGFGMVACSQESASMSTSKTVSIDAIRTQAKGFSVGSAVRAKTVYVFFDPQCPHCGHLWEASKPLLDSVKFVWIPVAFAGPVSVAEGAGILSAADPGQTMDQHEKLLKETGKGIAAPSTDGMADAVDSNTKLITAFGFDTIPAMVMSDVNVGGVKSHMGQMETAELSKWVGL